MRKRSRTTAVVLAGLMVVALAAPAGAIVFGQPDTDDEYSNVGSIVAYDPEEEVWVQWCSGTLIHDDVFLTAAHCTALIEHFEVEFRVTFENPIPNTDGVIDLGAGTFFEGDIYNHDDWNWFQGRRGASDPADIAVIVLDSAPPEIEPARLPELGLLDQLSPRVLRNTTFTAVGYGTTRDSMRTAFQNIEPNLDRNFAEQSFFSLTPAWLTLAMVNTPGLRSGGTCFGDSGGPHFIHRNGIETDIVASITVIGDRWCKATDKTYRVDTARSLNFLEQFLND